MDALNQNRQPVSSLCGPNFIAALSAEALESAAVNHPYLQALRDGSFPDVEGAFRDFAFQYGHYSKTFTHYVAAVIDNLESEAHRDILRANLAEEQGNAHDVELPPAVLATVVGQPHARLYRRFQEAIGVDAAYREQQRPCQTSLVWQEQFAALCERNAYVGVGAIGIGTELIVSRIYDQILSGLKQHSRLTMSQRVFFDLHSQCDDDHANDLLQIAESLAQTPEACEQITYGARAAISLRVRFWDAMLERASQMSCADDGGSQNTTLTENTLI